ncbi:MAG TPA: zinc dependent phospholipase C family protein, partial [Terriglobales bacterium]|nr:zinc dependent phospholipase C family protein [Terriglobales bacterium]
MLAVFHSRRWACVLVLLSALLLRARSSAYSVLSHEELVDLLWQGQIQPLLVGRYPALTPAQLNQAHAYAYGGAVIQDLGYYPFGSTFFSNLMHYVRSGDFVMELIRQSQSADEFAFALGALSHYAGDTVGHPASVNQAVAIEYPKLRKRYGNYVTYPEDRIAHLKTEFGFDMEQVALHRYAPQQYHEFIGFQVSKPLLQRVFPVVYGLPLATVLPNDNLAIGTFRWSVSQVIPEMTQVALQV